MVRVACHPEHFDGFYIEHFDFAQYKLRRNAQHKLHRGAAVVSLIRSPFTLRSSGEKETKVSDHGKAKTYICSQLKP